MTTRRRSDFERGARAAASLAAEYRTTHPYRVDDCILFKLNIIKTGRPRRNERAIKISDDVFVAGVFVAGLASGLAEARRSFDASVVSILRRYNMTAARLRVFGVSPRNVVELRKAGVR